MVLAEQFDHEPRTEEMTALLESREASDVGAVRSRESIQGAVGEVVQAERRRAAFRASILSSGQEQGEEMHSESEPGVCQPPEFPCGSKTDCGSKGSSSTIQGSTEA